jgi:pimeloyl-ACP methyl ester carboxylesterase
MLAAPCKPSYSSRLTTIASDWNDIGAVVDHLRALRSVEKVSMIAWSLGGPRAGGYASQHPEKVERLVLLAPAYSLEGGERPAKVPADGAAMSTQSHAEFTAGWDRQVGCPRSMNRRSATRCGLRCSPRIRLEQPGARVCGARRW